MPTTVPSLSRKAIRERPRGPRTARPPCGPPRPRGRGSKRRPSPAAPRRGCRTRGLHPAERSLFGWLSPLRGSPPSPQLRGRERAPGAVAGDARLAATGSPVAPTPLESSGGPGAQHDHARRRARCWPGCGESPPHRQHRTSTPTTPAIPTTTRWTCPRARGGCAGLWRDSRSALAFALAGLAVDGLRDSIVLLGGAASLLPNPPHAFFCRACLVTVLGVMSVLGRRGRRRS